MSRNGVKKTLVYLMTSIIAVFIIGVSAIAGYSTTITLLMNRHPVTEFYQQAKSDFEARTGIKVRFVIVPQAELDPKMKITLAAGSKAYDIVNPNEFSLSSYAAPGFLEDLTDYIEQTGREDPTYNLKGIVPALLISQRYKGIQYAIPIGGETTMFYYRKDIFEKYGLSVPKTNEEWLTLVKKVHDPDNRLYGTVLRGLKAGMNMGYIWSHWLFSYGGAWYDPESYNTLVNTPGAVYGTKLFVEMLRHAPAEVFTIGWDELGPVFLKGNAVTTLDANVLGQLALDPARSDIVDKVGFAVVPKGWTRTTAISAWSMAISKFSENKEEAWKFIKWATSDEIQRRLMEMPSPFALYGITREEILGSPEYGQKTAPEFQKAFLENLKYGVLEFSPLVPEALEISDVVSEAIYNIYDGADAQQELDKAAWQVHDILEKAGYYKD